MISKHPVPNLYAVQELKNWDVDEMYKLPLSNEHRFSYRPARALGFQGLCLLRRFKVAWGVFVGRYDAVRWGDTK